MNSDQYLGMSRAITRRDFIGGVAVTATGLGLTGRIAADNYQAYPPARTGMRGSHPGSFNLMHELAFNGSSPSGNLISDKTPYDLVVVGGGLSGLSAAYFYRVAKPNARILILDNHDDFGGHAKRNEFFYQGKTYIGFGGSQTLEDPGQFSKVTKNLLRELTVDLSTFYDAFDQSFAGNHGLRSQVFFDKEHYGVDRLVPITLNEYQDPSFAHHANNVPLSERARAELLKLLTENQRSLRHLNRRQRREFLGSISIEQFLREHLGCGDEVVHLLGKISLNYWALGIDALSARDAVEMWLPGFGGLLRQSDADEEPYIFHFPDGNASLARLLVKKLIPGITSADNMMDMVTARIDYGALDQPDEGVRIRLNSTVINVAEVRDNHGANIRIRYATDGQLSEVYGKDCVLACYHRAIPHICPALPAKQKAALAQSVKGPLVYTNVLVRNWHALKNLHVGKVYCPNGLYHSIAMDFPVSLGGYEFAKTPDDPVVLRLVHVPYTRGTGLSAKDQWRLGRRQMMARSFADHERSIRQQLTSILEPGGFNAKRDIEAITVNRWPHGYTYEYIPLWDKYSGEGPHVRARKTQGRIAIAGSDSGGSAYAQAAIDQAFRAVRDLV